MPSYFSPCITDEDSACLATASLATGWFADPLADADLSAVGCTARAPATSETAPIVNPRMAAPITPIRSVKLSTHTVPLIVLVMDNFIGALLFSKLLFSKFGLFKSQASQHQEIEGT
jgi:hypothetical protein